MRAAAAMLAGMFRCARGQGGASGPGTWLAVRFVVLLGLGGAPGSHDLRAGVIIGGPPPPPPPVSAALLTSPGVPVEWEVAHGGNGHRYEYVESPSGITWDAAKLLAEHRGGYLATPATAAENEFVFNLVGRRAAFVWLGGQQPPGLTPAAGWQWVNGEGPVGAAFWSGPEPNDNAGHDENRLAMLAMVPSAGASWNDEGATVAGFGFVVEYGGGPAASSVEVVVMSADAAPGWRSPVVLGLGVIVIYGGVLAVLWLLRRQREGERHLNEDD